MLKPVNGHDERALPNGLYRWITSQWRSLTLPYRTAFYWTCWTRPVLATLRNAGGLTRDSADMAYSDDTDVVGDASAVMGPV